ncbi:MAG: zinc ribbon domain-containing protein [Candidatus Nitrosotenuis sp.]|nr:MAG: zinc ribbon domain-containing protein [Candidatus Nitrosotenuis sp.]
MTFCQSCGKEFTADENFCSGCGKPRFSQTPIYAGVPTGITVLGILQIIAGILLAVFTVMVGTMSGMMGSFSHFGAMASVVGGAITAVLAVLAAFSFLIASALFSGKKWGRTIVIVFSLITLVMEAVSMTVGNVFAIGGMILNGIVLYYMWRPHVIAYFH